jgi:hypothetical protein
MKAILNSDPLCQWYLGKATAYRVAATFFFATEDGRKLFRGMMRDNAKSAIAYARRQKGVV